MHRRLEANSTVSLYTCAHGDMCSQLYIDAEPSDCEEGGSAGYAPSSRGREIVGAARGKRDRRSRGGGGWPRELVQASGSPRA